MSIVMAAVWCGSARSVLQKVEEGSSGAYGLVESVAVDAEEF